MRIFDERNARDQQAAAQKPALPPIPAPVRVAEAPVFDSVVGKPAPVPQQVQRRARPRALVVAITDPGGERAAFEAVAMVVLRREPDLVATALRALWRSRKEPRSGSGSSTGTPGVAPKD